MSEFNLPEGWVSTFVGALFTATQGVQISKSNQVFSPQQGYRKYLYISDFKNDNSPKWVKDDFPEKVVTKDDLIMANTGTPGAIFFGIDGILSNNLFKIGFERALIKKGYAYYFFISPIFKSHLSENHKQTAQPHIGHKVFGEAPFVLPPLAEQQQIAQKLDELLAQVDTLKTRLDAIPKILKRFRQSVLAAAVGGRLTESNQANWGVEKIDDLVTIVNGKAFPSGDYQNFGVRLLRPGNLHMSGQVVWNEKNTTYIPESWKERRPELVLNDSALLMNLTAQSLADEFLGRVCLFKKVEETVLLNQRICSFVPKTGYDIKPYLYIYFRSPQFREYVDTLDSGTLIKHLNIKDVKEYSISLPSYKEQTEIVHRVEQLFAYADQIEQRVKGAQARVNHLTQSILAKAFRGELTADWRAQNPELISGENSAAALLEKIKAEREVGRTKGKRK